MIPLLKRSLKLRLAVLLSGLLSLAACSSTPPGVVQGALTGIGSNVGQGAVSAWGLTWSREVKGTSVSYSPDGSAAGLKAFRDGQAQFTVASAPLSESEAAAVRGQCTEKGAVSLAAGVLPVGVAVKIKGVNEITLDARSLAGILKGEISRWNDPEIASLNPGRSLPDVEISVIAEEGPSDTTRAINEYLAQEPGIRWEPSAPDRWPSGVKGLTSSRALDRADKLDETNGGLSILDGSIIGNRFTAAQLVFEGKARRLEASSVVDAVTSGQVRTSPSGVVQGLDGRSGYALATILYVYLCREYTEKALNGLTRSFGASLLGEDAQKNANAHAFVMSPGKQAISDGQALVNAIGEAR